MPSYVLVAEVNSPTLNNNFVLQMIELRHSKDGEFVEEEMLVSQAPDFVHSFPTIYSTITI